MLKWVVLVHFFLSNKYQINEFSSFDAACCFLEKVKKPDSAFLYERVCL